MVSIRIRVSLSVSISAIYSTQHNITDVGADTSYVRI